MSDPGTVRGSAASWDDLARRASRPGESAGTVGTLRQLLCLSVDGSPYAVPIESVREIVRMRKITPIPRVTHRVCGVISLRGEIIQVLDLRRRLGLPAFEATKSSRIVVVQLDDGRVAGLLVDAVQEVLRVGEEAIDASAAADVQGIVSGLCTRGEEFVSLLDLERVLELQDDA
jgi:purine-binding chemotaxis protein CheW